MFEGAWKPVARWWRRKGVAARRALAVVFTAAAGLGIGGVGAATSAGDLLSSRMSLELGQPAGAMQLEKQQFVPLSIDSGELKVAAVPPCVPGNPNCYVAVQAHAPRW